MRILLTTLALFINALLIAQAPALIPYQAVARDASGQPLANTNVNARFTIHDGAAAGASVWQELQTVSTSALGLFTVQLGSSMPLTTVNWADGSKFMQVEIDLGSGFVDIGTQQMLSVPYALHAGSVHLDVSATGDTLFVGDGSFAVVPGISEANSNQGGVLTTGTTLHSCGEPNVHNPYLVFGSMIDQEGNSYKTIKIGPQEWMAENLNTSIYRNGDDIIHGIDNSIWTNANSSAIGLWAYYNDDPEMACPFGKLYNWYACVDNRQLCPLGWHVPTEDDLVSLIDYLGGTLIAGGPLKSIGNFQDQTGLWSEPNTAASNSTGFSGIPSGIRLFGNFSTFNGMGEVGVWWSSTAVDAPSAYTRLIDYNTYSVFFGSSSDKRDGLPVRCLRD